MAREHEIWQLVPVMDSLNPPTVLKLVGHYGRLRHWLRSELGNPPLVLPNNTFFPDRFDGSQPATQRLLERMQKHAGIDDIPVTAVLDAESAPSNGCSTGGCGPSVSPGSGDTPARLLLDEERGWLLRLEPHEVSHPVGLTTLVSRALGLVFLEETRPSKRRLPDPVAVYQELSAVMLGLGVLLLEGSHIYSKSCGGPRVASLTALDTTELALAVALFCADNSITPKQALRTLSTTQHAALDEATALIRGNPQLVEWIRHATFDDPTPVCELAPPRRPLLGGLFERKPKRQSHELGDFESALQLLSNEGQLPQANRRLPAQTRAIDPEIKALVAEALKD